jgi:hypothetical protein
MNSKKIFPFYCLLFSIYPALALIGHNITEDSWLVAIRPIAFSLFLSIFVLGLSWLAFRSLEKAGLFTLLSLVLFYSFGHITNLIPDFTNQAAILDGLWLPLLLSLIIWFVFGFMVYKVKTNLSLIGQYLTIVSIVLVIFPVYQVISYSIQRIKASPSVPLKITSTLSNSNNKQTLPDIYFIILDSYTRQDTLQKYYNFDNQDFIDELQNRGFYVASCSRSNYQYTLLSLSSTLNLDYLQNLDSRFTPGKYRVDFMEDLIDHNIVRQDLAQLGYQFIAFQSFYNGTTIQDADQLITMPQNQVGKILFGSINPFESMLLNSTALQVIFHLPESRAEKFINRLNFPFWEEVKIQQFQLSSLPLVSKEIGPKFVFVHMNIPHKPFIFNPDGSVKSTIDYSSPNKKNNGQVGYIDQIKYLNSQLPSIIDQLIKNSNPSPIIIIQGDHGMNTAGRSTILNAYYVPKPIYADLYNSISPVNTFRIILNNIAGKEYPMLEDHSYASATDARFDTHEVYEKNKGCIK